MLRTERRCLNSMKNLHARVWTRAIHIANAVPGEGFEEGRAIHIA